MVNYYSIYWIKRSKFERFRRCRIPTTVLQNNTKLILKHRKLLKLVTYLFVYQISSEFPNTFICRLFGRIKYTLFSVTKCTYFKIKLVLIKHTVAKNLINFSNWGTSVILVYSALYSHDRISFSYLVAICVVKFTIQNKIIIRFYSWKVSTIHCLDYIRSHTENVSYFLDVVVFPWIPKRNK